MPTGDTTADRTLTAASRTEMRYLAEPGPSVPVGKRPHEAGAGAGSKRAKASKARRSPKEGGGTSASAVFTWESTTSAIQNAPKDGECTDVQALNEKRKIRTPEAGAEGGENDLSQALVDMLERAGRPGDEMWVKGHLLNGELGGPGISENLTPMTHTANMNYKGKLETPVKRAIERMRQLKTLKTVKGMDGIDRLKIKFDVQVSDDVMFPDSDVDCERSIRSYIDINVRYDWKLCSDETLNGLNSLVKSKNAPLPQLPPRTRMNPVTGEFKPAFTLDPAGMWFPPRETSGT